MTTPAGNNNNGYPYSPDNPFADWYPQRANPTLDRATNDALFIAFQDIYALRRHMGNLAQNIVQPANVAVGAGFGAGGVAAPAGTMTFGLDLDQPVGPNAVGKYGNVISPGKPFIANLSCVTVPGNNNTVLDVQYSHDKGNNWNSIFLPGNLFAFPMNSTVHVIEFDTIFASVSLAIDDLLRVDILQTGGAQGITGVIKWQ